MVFMFSTLSNKNYELYRVIVTAFEKIKVKGQELQHQRWTAKEATFVVCVDSARQNVRKCYKNVQVEKLCLKVSIQLASTKKKMKKNLGIICIFSWH